MTIDQISSLIGPRPAGSFHLGVVAGASAVMIRECWLDDGTIGPRGGGAASVSGGIVGVGIGGEGGVGGAGGVGGKGGGSAAATCDGDNWSDEARAAAGASNSERLVTRRHRQEHA
jgi:hypothetical protein